jgi:hypothetical protein
MHGRGRRTNNGEDAERAAFGAHPQIADQAPDSRLAPVTIPAHIVRMTWRERWWGWKRTHGIRQAILATGWVLILLSVPVGLLPGPGGVFVAAAGFALILQTSAWAKRAYVRMKRRWPRLGGVVDRALRRRSAARRRARDQPAVAAASN